MVLCTCISGLRQWTKSVFKPENYQRMVNSNLYALKVARQCTFSNAKVARRTIH